MQIQALQHIARSDPALPVPRVVALPEGGFETPVVHETGGIQRVRLLTWLPGTNLSGSRRSLAQREACGRLLARVERALEDFHHPANHHELVWDLKHAVRMREVSFAVPDGHARARIGAVFDAFAARVTPVLDSLRHQAVHNDMNGLNTLVDSDDHDRLAGLIDFGDMVETAVVIDVATGGPAQLGADMPTKDALGLYIHGFHAVRPLLAAEVALLPLMIAIRVAMSVTLQAWHRSVQPENPHYADLTEADYRRRLGHIAEIRAPATAQALRRACGLG